MTSPEVIFTICRRTTASPYHILKSLVTEIGRRMRSAEASLVVRILLLWPLSFETSGATTAMAVTQTIILAATIYKSLAAGSAWRTSN